MTYCIHHIYNIMALQAVPPPMTPPSPPGLPIDSGLIILFVLAVIYGLIVIRRKAKKPVEKERNYTICVGEKKVNKKVLK